MSGCPGGHGLPLSEPQRRAPVRVAPLAAVCALGVLAACAPAGDDPTLSADEEAALVQSLEAAGMKPFLRPRGITLEVPWEHHWSAGARDTLRDRPPSGDLAYVGPGQPPLKVFLNRFGGTYSPGSDDSRRNTSIVPRQVSTITPFSQGDAAWRTVADCVRDQFARFNLLIVEQEPPASERYTEHVIGGRPQQVGLPSGVGGVAPIDNFRCGVLDIAINYTFSDVYGSNLQEICHTAAQEIAHSFSLDHELHCPDPMTYLGGCGAKTFRDVNAQCGEFQPRACNCNRASQNSVQIMFEKLGPNQGIEPPPPPPNDSIPPVVSITSPQANAVLQPDSTITITATATDNNTVAATELVWDFSGDVFACPTNFGGGAVVCTRSGSTSTWNVRVGQGSRTFSVRARDGSGNQAETPKRTIHLSTDGTPPPTSNDTTPPAVSILSPSNGAVLAANSTIQVAVLVNDDSALAAVELLWNATGDAFPCPFAAGAVACAVSGSTYTWTLNVGVGTRAFQVRAVDTANNQTVSAQRTITLSTDPDLPLNPDADIVGEPNDSPGEAFGLRCGNALDLVVANNNEDWFAVDAPADTAVEVGIGAAAGTVIGLQLTTAGGEEVLVSSTDILGSGGTLRTTSRGPVVLARVTTPGGPVPYRFTVTCSEEGGDRPLPGVDDDLEPNDTVEQATRAFCGQEKTQLIAANPDWFMVEVRERDSLRVALTGDGVVARIQDATGQDLSAVAADVTATALPQGNYAVLIEPTGPAAFYDVSFRCLPAGLAEVQGGCSCTSAGAEALGLPGAAALLLLWRRRRRHR